MDNFTHEDLLLYLYKESSPEFTTAIENALATNWSLREAYYELAVTVSNLAPTGIQPRQQTIDNILQYAERSIGELTTEA